jgi:hypothetical protein
MILYWLLRKDVSFGKCLYYLIHMNIVCKENRICQHEVIQKDILRQSDFITNCEENAW